MLGFLAGVAVGAVACVSSQVVYNWVKSKTTAAETVVESAASNVASSAASTVVKDIASKL
jgi:hypothetical protein